MSTSPSNNTIDASLSNEELAQQTAHAEDTIAWSNNDTINETTNEDTVNETADRHDEAEMTPHDDCEQPPLENGAGEEAAAAGSEDTEPKPETNGGGSDTSQSRKRKHDDQRENSGHGNGKRNSRGNNNHHHNTGSSSSENEVFIKLMIPSSAAGGVIGRGGEKIAQMQKEANVKMKMSKANDYYPNTNERVCLIVGSVKSVLKAHELIVERIHEKPDNSSKSSGGGDEDRASIIKLLIPNTTAGLLIGKGGTYIKTIKDESGAFVQISSKQTDLPERVVTIEGDKEKRNRALAMVVKKIAEDPQHSSMPSLNYASMGGGGGGGSDRGGGSSQSNASDSYSSQSSRGGQMDSGSSKFDFNAAANYLAGLNNLALLIINCGGSFQMTAESLKVALRNTGYSSSATMEIIDAITVLMSYGLITKVTPTSALASNLGGIANLAGIAGLAGLVGNTGSGGGSGGYGGMGGQHQGGMGGHHQQHHMNGSGGSSSNAVNLNSVLQILSNSLGKR